MVRGSNSGRGRRFFSCPRRFRLAVEPTEPSINECRNYYSGARGLGREIKYCHPSVTEVKNEW